MRRFVTSGRGFTTVELLMVLALGAVILGAVAVTYGTLVSVRGSVVNSVNVQLPGSLASNFYDAVSPVRNVAVAPDYGTLAEAEKLREQFVMDSMSGSAVFCLYRNPNIVANVVRQSWYPYDLATDGLIESSQDFRDFLISKDPRAGSLFLDYRNPRNDRVMPPSHASVFVVGFSSDSARLGIIAIYEVDVIAMTAARPWGFYASVRRYTHLAANADSPSSAFSGGYEIFYEPSVPNAASPKQFASDGFTPIFVTFERRARLAVLEENRLGIDRFKRAAEQPFYFMWWPDPTAVSLEVRGSGGDIREARSVYNHMGGRTAFMFTVPVFPAL